MLKYKENINHVMKTFKSEILDVFGSEDGEILDHYRCPLSNSAITFRILLKMVNNLVSAAATFHTGSGLYNHFCS